MKCEVCGRGKEQLEEEFSIDIEIKEHQGLTKCSKCIREYETETRSQEQMDDDQPAENSADWKNRITA